MRVFIASDHGGFSLKEFLKQTLSKKFEVKDFGCNSGESCDYPDFAEKAAKAVAESNGKALGILCCGTGIGMSLAANKVKGIRAAVVYDEFTAKMSRAHNNANIACFGGRNIDAETALRLAEIFLATAFEGEQKEGARHLQRVQKIAEIEKKYFK
jgi:ribose 5-phosphate isomerase B